MLEAAEAEVAAGVVEVERAVLDATRLDVITVGKVMVTGAGVAGGWC